MDHNPYSPPKASLQSAQLGGAAEPARQPVEPLHSTSSIAIAGLIGGAFAAGYLVYSNLKTLGQRERAKLALTLFSIGGVVALYVAWNTPSDLISFELSVGIPQLIAVLVGARCLQGNALATHRDSGGKFRSQWIAVAAALIANLSIRELIYVLSLVFD